MDDADYLDFLRAQSGGAAWVTSVCEGALLLASAGLLDGYQVAVKVQQVTQYFPYPPIRGSVPVAAGCPIEVP